MSKVSLTAIPQAIRSLSEQLEALGGGDARLVPSSVSCIVGDWDPSTNIIDISTKTSGKHDVVISVKDPRCSPDAERDHGVRRYTTFSNALRHGFTPQDIRSSFGQPIAKWVIDGFNATVVANGSSDIGKTTAVYGENGICDSILQMVFNLCGSNEDNESSNFEFALQLWEVNGQSLTDLVANYVLGQSPSSISDGINSVKNPVCDGGPSLQCIGVSNYENCCRVLDAHRCTSDHWQQSTSSRPSPIPSTAHLFLRIFAYEKSRQRLSCMTIVDFADCQTLTLTGGRQSHNRQYALAAQQLLSVNKIITDLASMNSEDRNSNLSASEGIVVSNRDTLLASIIGPLLTGNSRLFYIAFISSCADRYLDTTNTLRIATRAAAIECGCFRMFNVSPDLMKYIPMETISNVGNNTLDARRHIKISNSMKSLPKSHVNSSDSVFSEMIRHRFDRIVDPVSTLPPAVAIADHSDAWDSVLDGRPRRDVEAQLDSFLQRDAHNGIIAASHVKLALAEVQLGLTSVEIEVVLNKLRPNSYNLIEADAHLSATCLDAAVLTVIDSATVKLDDSLFSTLVRMFEVSSDSSDTVPLTVALRLLKRVGLADGQISFMLAACGCIEPVRSSSSTVSIRFRCLSRIVAKTANTFLDKQGLVSLYNSCVSILEHVQKNENSPSTVTIRNQSQPKQIDANAFNDTSIASLKQEVNDMIAFILAEGYDVNGIDAGRRKNMSINKEHISPKRNDGKLPGSPAVSSPLRSVESSSVASRPSPPLSPNHQSVNNVNSGEHLSSNVDNLSNNYDSLLEMLKLEQQSKEKLMKELKEMSRELKECKMTMSVEIDTLHIENVELKRALRHSQHQQHGARPGEESSDVTRLSKVDTEAVFASYEREVEKLLEEVNLYKSKSRQLEAQLASARHRGATSGGSDTVRKMLDTANQQLSQCDKERSQWKRKERFLDIQSRRIEDLAKRYDRLIEKEKQRNSEMHSVSDAMSSLRSTIQTLTSENIDLRQHCSELNNLIEQSKHDLLTNKKEAEYTSRERRREHLLSKIIVKVHPDTSSLCKKSIHMCKRVAAEVSPTNTTAKRLLNRLLKDLEVIEQDRVTSITREEQLIALILGEDDERLLQRQRERHDDLTQQHQQHPHATKQYK